MNKQNHAPLFEALKKHISFNPLPFHVPGHQMGTAFDQEAKPMFSSLLPYDLTEISGLDDLHQPTGVIEEAQKLAAACFGADKTYFLVNGSTVGNIAIIMSTCLPGETIIIPRNVHKSVIHGCLLARVRPVYLTSQFDEELGVATSPSFETIKAALEQHPHAKAVFLTCPNYYGMGVDLRPISELVHRYNIPLLVDEAHGAHYGFHDQYPRSALQQGSDAVVQSTHKMLTSLTMGSMLHIRGERVNQSKVKQILGMLQSSSPSYLILSSLDLARRYVWQNGKEAFQHIYHWSRSFAEKLNSNSSLFYSPHDVYHSHAYSSLDPCKLIIHSKEHSFSGFELRNRLEKEGIYVELADMNNVLAVCSIGTTESRVNKLLDTLLKLEKDFFENYQNKQETRVQITNTPLPSFSLNEGLPIDQVMGREQESIPLTQALGRICAELIIPYPPGVPIVAWGELFTEPLLDYISALKNEGATFQGVSDPMLHKVRVVKL